MLRAIVLTACLVPASLVPALAAGDAGAVGAAGTAALPSTLQPPDGSVLKLKLAAKGVQIYQCQGAEWKLQGPEAQLYDAQGKQQAKHYAGPTWEAADGSKVVGSAIAHDDGPDHAAVPWLLLKATSNSGSGLFGNVRAIQRLHTVGGKAPAAACGADNANRVERVVYSADYYFYTDGASH